MTTVMIVAAATCGLAAMLLGSTVSPTSASQATRKAIGARRASDQRKNTDEPLQQWAGISRDVAALVEAGITADAAWRAATAGHCADDVRHVHAALVAGRGVDAALTETARRTTGPIGEALTATALGWTLVMRSGFSAATVSTGLAADLAARFKLRRAIDVARAAPRATMTALAVVPVLGWLIGFGMGANPPLFLLTTAPGWACLGIAAVCVTGMLTWTRALGRRAAACDTVALMWASVATTLAAGVRVGLPAGQGLRAIADTDPTGECTVRRQARLIADQAALGASWSELAQPGDDSHAAAAGVCSTIRLATDCGAPIADLLMARAAVLRENEFHACDTRVAALSTHMVMPITLCGLPAFICIAVVPLVIHLFDAVTW